MEYFLLSFIIMILNRAMYVKEFYYMFMVSTLDNFVGSKRCKIYMSWMRDHAPTQLMKEFIQIQIQKYFIVPIYTRQFLVYIHKVWYQICRNTQTTVRKNNRNSGCHWALWFMVSTSSARNTQRLCQNNIVYTEHIICEYTTYSPYSRFRFKYHMCISVKGGKGSWKPRWVYGFLDWYANGITKLG